MAFTDYETEQLRKALLKETRHCAVTLGMKKTSVEQLTKAVGISKGSFYKFYESKEMLFFAVLEGIHSELYGVADHALSETDGLPPSARAAKAVLAVCRRLSDTGPESAGYHRVGHNNTFTVCRSINACFGFFGCNQPIKVGFRRSGNG